MKHLPLQKSINCAVIMLILSNINKFHPNAALIGEGGVEDILQWTIKVQNEFH